MLNYRPWGFFTDYYRTNTCVMKQIVIEPNERLSYQYHNYRNEFWVVEQGCGIITINGRDTKVEKGFSILICCGVKHTIQNVSDSNLCILETQFGSKCDEEDIIRLDDKYGRCDEKKL